VALVRKRTIPTGDRRLSAKLMPTSVDRVCHVVSVTDPYGRILGFLDRTCCVNPVDNTHYAPVTTAPSTRTKYFTITLAQSVSLEHSNKYGTVKEEIRRYSSLYSGRLSAHPNDLIVNFIELPDNRLFRRHLSNDPPTRFLVQLSYL
jgi:hypothetical protein